ncbi:MAG: hypothetical protein KDA73_15640 [Rhodobacteraceae bacterium]|nr:hypothetical protein [Paracoccaceae bacterium]
MRALALPLLLLATPVAAFGDTVADISISCNPHGAVVTMPDGPTYYLGKQCDAARKGGGDGKWWFAASVFIVEIGGEAVRFPFDLDCDVPYCRP